MKKVVRSLFLIAQLSVLAQSQRQSISIDSRRPYLDIVFERSGKRNPIYEGELEDGLWLKLRNNCIVPAKVYVLRREGHDLNSKYIVHEVIMDKPMPVIPGSGLKPIAPKPDGYSNTDIVSFETIAPGGSLTFSVPINHVTRRWDLQVEVFLQDPSNQAGKLPRVFVGFDWFGLDRNAQTAADRILYGHVQK